MIDTSDTILLLMPVHLVPPERVITLSKLNNEDLVTLYRNTCCARYREEVFSDTLHKLDFIRGGERHLHDELLRRLQPDVANPAAPPASTGGRGVLAACLAKVQQLQHRIAPRLAPNQAGPSPNQTPDPSPTSRPSPAKPQVQSPAPRRDRGGSEI